MIDKRKLCTLNAKVEQRDDWLNLQSKILEAIDKEVKPMRPALIRLTIDGTDTTLSFSPDDLEDIAKIKILELEKEINSLVSQFLRLDLKGEEEK